MPFAVQALAKYAFGLGTVTMVLTTLVFTGMSLPPGQGLGTQIMVKVIDFPTEHYHLYKANMKISSFAATALKCSRAPLDICLRLQINQTCG